MSTPVAAGLALAGILLLPLAGHTAESADSAKTVVKDSVITTKVKAAILEKVSVKGGENVGPAMVKDLIATIVRDKAEIGLFLTLAEPTKAMSTEAVATGFYESASGKKYPRLQILTIESLLAGTAHPEHPDYEPDLNFKKARAEASGEQAELV